MLYGALTCLDRHGGYLQTPSKAGVIRAPGQQEQHNILLLSSGQSRLPLLPMSTQSAGSRSAGLPSQATIVQPPKPKVNPITVCLSDLLIT